MNSAMVGPGAEYLRRLEARRRTTKALERRDGRLANARLGVFVAGLVWALAAFAWLPALKGWIALPVVLFLCLVALHDVTLRRKVFQEGAVRFYERALDRLEGRWAGKGTRGDDLAPEDHLYAEDLDLFGEASLFELLCTARTRVGEEVLAGWLCAPASTEEIAARQEAVEELRERIDFREELALLGGEIRASVRPERLTSWAEAPGVLRSARLRYLVVGLTALAVVALLGWAFFGTGAGPLVLVVIVELLVLRRIRGDVEKVLAAMDEPLRELNVLALLLKRLEAEPFASKKLERLRAGLMAQGVSASTQIAGLYRLLTWAEQQRNMFFAPLALVLMWTVHFAFALERWRATHGKCVARWLSVVGEFEALSALAAYAYEHPADPFPELVEEGLTYEGRGLGHPLIPQEQCVRNDVGLGDRPRMLLVSGSNMSGKSTLLRTVGVNAVLAYAGAPVCAESLRLSPLAIGATLRIHDSIQSGTSRFYSEIKRLKQLVELTEGPLPLLFLVDELLHGTNSHDRRVGGAAMLRALMDRGAVGLVTTHDLALTETAGALGGRAVNVHFADHLEGDSLAFDYRMRPGVVKKSNAIALMRAVGLPV